MFRGGGGGWVGEGQYCLTTNLVVFLSLSIYVAICKANI